MGDKKRKEIYFKDLKVGQKAEGWGDLFMVFPTPTWIGFCKMDEHTAKIIEVNGVSKSDCLFSLSFNDKVWIEE